MSRGEGGGECLLSALTADAFGCIVEAVAMRLRPETDAGFYTNQCVRTLCQNFLEARRELRTLALVPGQAVDPKYLCTDPNGALWQHAHIIFGIDPAAPGFGKMPRCSLRANFLLLREAFDPDLEYETWHGDFHNVPGQEWDTVSVWDELWGTWDPDMVDAWEENAAEIAYEEYVAELQEDGGDVDPDSFETWHSTQDFHGALPKYPVSEKDIVWFHSKLRLPRGTPAALDEEFLKNLRLRLRGMLSGMRDRELDGADDHKRHVFLPPRPVRRPGRPATYAWVGPSVQAQEEAFVRKLEALRVLFRTIKRQLKAA